MTTAKTLVLFDIDGTLVHTGRAGLRGMNAAIQRLFGRADAMNDVPFAGRTDRAIVSDVLGQAACGTAGGMKKVKFTGLGGASTFDIPSSPASTPIDSPSSPSRVAMRNARSTIRPRGRRDRGIRD